MSFREHLNDLVGWIEDRTQRLFVRIYETAYEHGPFVAAVILIVLVIGYGFLAPLLVLAFIDDVYQATLMTTALFYCLVVLPILVSVLLAAYFWRLFPTFLAIGSLRAWCRKHGLLPVGYTLLKYNGLMPRTWRTVLSPVVQRSDEQIALQKVRTVDTLIDVYLGRLTELREAAPGTSVMPANFVIYAHCVQEVLEQLSTAAINAQDMRIVIRSLFTDTITRWFNPIDKRLPGGGSIRVTARWWEQYRRDVKSRVLSQRGIAFLRLVKHPTVSSDWKNAIRIQRWTGNDDDNTYVAGEHVPELREDVEQFCANRSITFRWLGNFEKIREKDQRMMMHPLLVVQDFASVEDELSSWRQQQYRLVNALASFLQNSHEHGTYNFEEAPTGAWVRFVKPSDEHKDTVIADNDDLFLIEYQQGGEKVDDFGMTFAVDIEHGIAGIRLLDPDSVHQAVREFDEVWREQAASY